MLRRIAIAATLCLLTMGGVARADEQKPFKATVEIRGVVTEGDAEALRATLKKIPAIKVDASAIKAGEKGPFGHYFSPPFVIEFSEPAKTSLGAVGKAVAAARTSSRSEVPPSLNVVLFAANGTIDESDISAVREALSEVNGMAVRESGGTVGNQTEGNVRVRLDDSGNVALADIVAALKKANLDFHIQKP